MPEMPGTFQRAGRLLAVLLLILLLTGEGRAQSRIPVYERKDPFLAAAFSWFVPGLGQAYVGKPLKGMAFWAVDNMLFWGTILNIADVQFRLKRDIGFSFAVEFNEKPSTGRIMATIGLGVCYLAFHIYNVIDASDDAIEYNRKMAKAFYGEGISLGPGNGVNGVHYRIRF